MKGLLISSPSDRLPGEHPGKSLSKTDNSTKIFFTRRVYEDQEEFDAKKQTQKSHDTITLSLCIIPSVNNYVIVSISSVFDLCQNDAGTKESIPFSKGAWKKRQKGHICSSIVCFVSKKALHTAV